MKQAPRQGPTTVRCLLLALALLTAPPALTAADLLNQARLAVKMQRFDRAEHLLRQQLRRQKSDLDARFLLARVLAWQGKRREALVEYDVLIKANPRDADYLLGKAQTLVWDGKAEQALPLLVRARRLTPGYEEVWRLQITTLLALGGEERLRQARALRAMAQKRFPRSSWHFAALDSTSAPPPAASIAPRPVPPPQPAPLVLPDQTPGKIEGAMTPPKESTPGAPPRTDSAARKDADHTAYRGLRLKPSELELGASAEDLSGGLSGWRSVYLEGLHRFGERLVVYGTLRETRRFGFDDSEGQAGLTYPLSETWTLVAEGSVSPTHNVLAKYSVLGQLQKTLEHGWDVQAGIRHSQYEKFSVNTLIVTAERYWRNFRGAYSLYLARPEDGGTVPNHVVQFDYYYGERNLIGVVAGNGREVADIGFAGPLVTDVRSYVLRGRHWISPSWAISFEALHHEQGSLYTRQGARIGLRHAF